MPSMTWFFHYRFLILCTTSHLSMLLCFYYPLSHPCMPLQLFFTFINSSIHSVHHFFDIFFFLQSYLVFSPISSQLFHPALLFPDLSSQYFYNYSEYYGISVFQAAQAIPQLWHKEGSRHIGFKVHRSNFNPLMFFFQCPLLWEVFRAALHTLVNFT